MKTWHTTAIVLCCLAVSVTTVSAANAWGGSPAPFTGPQGFADDSSHSHRTIESTASDRNNWQWRFDGAGGEDNYEPTDLSFWKTTSNSSWVDVKWYVTTQSNSHLSAGVAGTVYCAVWASSTTCDSFRLLIADDADEMSSLLQNNLVCHELGHTVGFADGGTLQHSCMDGGDNNMLRPYERGKINARY